MNWNILLYIITITSLQVEAQHPYSVRFSYQIEKELADGEITPSRAGILYSLIGDYHQSASFSDIPVSWGVDTMGLYHNHTREALPYIIDQAKNHRIVIISENHLRPQHRIFADEIISALSVEGYHHLGLETFAPLPKSTNLMDVDLMKRGYPLDSPLTGTYTLEPQMGQLVRNAIALGYQLFAYERSEKIKGKDRDEIQADNIIRYLEAHPSAKIIILCGFHHAIESDLIKRKESRWMARYIKQKTGIDPLTIYQDNFTEKFSENEHSILDSMRISTPSILVDMNNNPLHISDQVDIEIVHPRTTYKDGRPVWLYRDSTMHSYQAKLESDATYPIIVSAYPIEEKGGVPVDRIELKHKYSRKALVLKEGRYRITIYNGESTTEYIETIE